MLRISVRRDKILENRQNGTNKPAWRISDGATEREATVIDFGGVRLIQSPANSEYRGACYIEADREPVKIR